MGLGQHLLFTSSKPPVCPANTPAKAAEQPKGREESQSLWGGMEVFLVITLLINCWPLAGVRAGCTGGCLLPPFLPSLSPCWRGAGWRCPETGLLGTGGHPVLLQGLGL